MHEEPQDAFDTVEVTQSRLFLCIYSTKYYAYTRLSKCICSTLFYLVLRVRIFLDPTRTDLF